ncbi:MAG: S41 family peptidase [Lachnospiraceae bacterium]|nr:S41 family peptidase [Lachnospiraceae bacterium]
MVAALGDPYSEYYTKEELEETLNSNKGISYGIGAYISLDQEMDMAMISGVMEDTPAEEAGLREGDIIYKVDGEETFGLSLSAVVSLVKGPENTTVHLTIYRENEPDFLEIDVTRGKRIETETVDSGMLEGTDNIGYLRIREFDGVTVDQFNEAMAELRANDMKGLVLDLRSNPGGDLTAVVDIARRLLPEGLIVYTEDKAGKRSEYTCDGEYEIDIPMVVLVNEYSASASEILSGAIKDYNKGTLIGTTTYGKGIVQRIIRLDDGTAVKLTVSAYFTPSGKNIHGIGIEPDIELEYDYEAYEKDGTDNQVEKAIEVLEGKIS